MRVLIVEARTHAHISEALADGATHELEKGGASFDRVSVAGALELPAAIAMAARSLRPYDGYVALGSILRGPGFHFETTVRESAHGLMLLGVSHGLCIGNGIIAAELEEDAMATAHESGGDAARACLTLIHLRARLGLYHD
jgi:6,7-dimethyl-8-ribityllumazine synthase